MNYVRLNSKNLKYQRFTPSYYTDIRVRKFEFVTKTHFLYIYSVHFPAALFHDLLEVWSTWLSIITTTSFNLKLQSKMISLTKIENVQGKSAK